MDSLDKVRTCYEWQINNLKVEGWAKKLREGKLEKIGLSFGKVRQILMQICLSVYLSI
jgi:hypothetical protein